ncbi:hypothetical protein GX586_08575 [bacterium]|nr:hypothetical protein [bacterium]
MITSLTTVRSGSDHLFATTRLTCIALIPAVLCITARAFGLPLDANGWTVFTPSPDSRICYVSSTSGNDGAAAYYAPSSGVIGSDPFNPTGAVKAFSTISAALAQARSGYPDWVLLKRGDAWYSTMAIKSGRSPGQPFLFGAYGEGARPLVKAASNTALSVCCNSFTNFAVAGIHLYAHTRDTNSSEYVSGAGSTGMRLYSGGMLANVLIEDCCIQFFLTAIVIEGNGEIENITIRRNVLIDSYSISSHSQGLYASHPRNFIVEENVFDHNGWLIQGTGSNTQAGGAATMFNHNTYIGSPSNAVFRNNLFLRGASMNNKWRCDTSGGSGAILIDNNLYAEAEIGIGIGGNTEEPYRFVGVTIISNVIIDVGRTRPTGRYLAWYMDIADWDGGIVCDNLFLRQTNGLGNTHGISMTGFCRDLLITSNIFHGFGSGVGLTYSIGTSKTDVVMADNIFQFPTSNVQIAQIAGAFTNYLFSGNWYYTDRSSSQWFRVNNVDRDITAWRALSGEADAHAGQRTFADPGRCVESYQATIDGTGSFESFVAAARAQSKQNWRADYTAQAVNDYIRQGFVIPEPLGGAVILPLLAAIRARRRNNAGPLHHPRTSRQRL